jgi:hypothetical protein
MHKKQEERIRTSITVPRELWERVKIRAVESRTTAEGLVKKALEAYLRGAK